MNPWVKVGIAWVAGSVVTGFALGLLIRTSTRFCYDSPSGLHCECWKQGARCCYCQFNDGPHTPYGPATPGFPGLEKKEA